ncbi:hypothetical protein QP185_04480 [Sphingomonas aerolata]|uniref:hypothetical protein n=1 Tax=Sphingomonas aerolata TaxID=185951 RepID=UPI002FE1BF68
MTEIAERHQLTPRCAASLSDIAVTAKAQNRESDLSFLRRLGRERGAVAKIARGVLIFRRSPPVSRRPANRSRPSPSRAATAMPTSSAARSTKRRAGGEGDVARPEIRQARTGRGRGGAGGKTLSRVYANEADAQALPMRRMAAGAGAGFV